MQYCPLDNLTSDKKFPWIIATVCSYVTVKHPLNDSLY